MVEARSPVSEDRWLLLIHRIPPKPDYLRVKMSRRLHRLGAVALKNSVYVLPRNDQALEDFHWVAREIVEAGGQATVCDAHFPADGSDGQIEALFRAAREADFAEVARETRDLAAALPADGAVPEPRRAETAARLRRLKSRRQEIAGIDFFGAPGGAAAERLLAALEGRLAAKPAPAEVGAATIDYRGRTWVTRQGVRVDRIASAWLIRRFVDPEARFKLVPPIGHVPGPGEVRFDMFEAEFSHQGDACTFETLCARLRVTAPGLRAVAEIVHDIDLKDQKFCRPETAGVAALIEGLCLAVRSDEERLDLGARLFEHLLASQAHAAEVNP